jgi:hypothetical protein
LRAVAVMAFALPIRAASRRQKAPKADSVRPGHGGKTQDEGGSAARGRSARAQQLATGDLIARSKAEPGGEVPDRRPAAHVGPDLGHETERRVRSQTVDVTEIGPTEAMKEGLEIEAGLVAPRLGRSSRGG